MPHPIDLSPRGEKRCTHRANLYREQGFWGDATLLDCWRMSVLRWPHKKAVIDSHGASLSFAEADAISEKIAAWLRAVGVEEGQTVSFQLPGWAEFLPVCVGCLKVGAVLNPIPPNLRWEEIRYILTLCQTKVLFLPYFYRKFYYADMAQQLLEQLPDLHTVLFVDKTGQCPADLPTLEALLASSAPVLGASESHLAAEPRIAADALAAVLFTSGSEGNPKGVMLSHNNIIFSESSFAAHMGISPYDVMLMPAPVTHATGFHHGVIMPMLMGATTVLQDIFVASRTLELISEHRCTVSMASSSFVYDLVCELCQKKSDISSLRFFMCGGAPVCPSMMEEAEELGLHIHNVYGSTESVPHTGIQAAHPANKKQNTAGKPVPGVEVRVVDKNRQPLPRNQEGEEASRGPQVFLGYMGHPEMTQAAIDDEGWYYSGDLSVMDDDGFVRISGRLKDVIIRGGENISSLEVENMLLRHSDISEVAVVAMPDPRLCEKVCAYVVLKAPKTELSLMQVTEFLVEQSIAKQKFPERIEVVEALPKTASGKIRKNVLRVDIAEKLNIIPK